MRFVKEMLNQMGQDVNRLVGGYGAITAYVIATLSVVTATLVIFFGIDPPDDVETKFWSVLALLVVVVSEVLLSGWIWEAGCKAKTKIAEENEKLMSALKPPGDY